MLSMIEDVKGHFFLMIRGRTRSTPAERQFIYSAFWMRVNFLTIWASAQPKSTPERNVDGSAAIAPFFPPTHPQKIAAVVTIVCCGKPASHMIIYRLIQAESCGLTPPLPPDSQPPRSITPAGLRLFYSLARLWSSTSSYDKRTSEISSSNLTMRSQFVLSLLPVLAAASPVLNVETIHNNVAPLLSSAHAKKVPNSYIVVFKKHVELASATQHHEWVQSLHVASQETRPELRKRSQISFATDIFEGLRHTFGIGDLLGYSGHFDEAVIEQVRRHPDVSGSTLDCHSATAEHTVVWAVLLRSHTVCSGCSLIAQHPKLCACSNLFIALPVSWGFYFGPQGTGVRS